MARAVSLALVLLAAGCHRGDPAAPSGPLEPWQPIDPSFKGCEGG